MLGKSRKGDLLVSAHLLRFMCWSLPSTALCPERTFQGTCRVVSTRLKTCSVRFGLTAQLHPIPRQTELETGWVAGPDPACVFPHG